MNKYKLVNLCILIRLKLDNNVTLEEQKRTQSSIKNPFSKKASLRTLNYIVLWDSKVSGFSLVCLKSHVTI